MKIVLFNDGSLFDIEDEYGDSVCELLPTMYEVEYDGKKYSLNEDSNDLLKEYSNATIMTVRLLAFKDDVGIERLDF